MSKHISRLHQLLEVAAAERPDNEAIVDPERGTSIDYRELDRLAGVISEALCRLDIHPGDRVGIAAPKSIGVVAAIFGILKSGAAYVPVDYSAPKARNAFIFSNCAVRALIVDASLLENLRSEYGEDALPVIEELSGLESMGTELVLVEGPPCDDAPGEELSGDLAYILYTSGSTGKPKGVMLTHRNALSFLNWCDEAFDFSEHDRFSSHAPFYFDLSILDLYVPVQQMSTLVLIGEDLGKQPTKLAGVIAEQRLTVWYSTPAILRLLVEFGSMKPEDYSNLRIVFFAGEVFPVKHLRALQAIWNGPEYYNLYGPTETNVCTCYTIPAVIPDNRNEPFPIGTVCSGDSGRVIDEDGNDVASGSEGELIISGGSVMQGYWSLPDRNAQAFIDDKHGNRWYRTGDIVREGDEGYLYVSRRDRMVKRKGYRVELGEIESALYKHEFVTEVAVIALPDEENGVLIKAFLSWSGDSKPSMVAMKRFCMDNLQVYMIPDLFSFLQGLPKTPTDKVDYQKLKGMD